MTLFSNGGAFIWIFIVILNEFNQFDYYLLNIRRFLIKQAAIKCLAPWKRLKLLKNIVF